MSKNPTVSQLTATAVEIVGKSMTEAEIKAILREHNLRSYKKVKEHFSALKVEKKTSGSSNKGRIRTTRVIEPGARGFRFAGKWNESVKAADGIAIHPFYLPKLIAHAESVGVSTKGTPQEIAAAIAAHL